MNAPSGKEQRAHERRLLRTQVELLLPGRAPISIRTTDISVAGIGLVAVANPPIGLEVGLRVPLPTRGGGLQVLELRARVAHSVFSRVEDGFRIGMVFVKPSDAQIVAIGDFLAR